MSDDPRVFSRRHSTEKKVADSLLGDFNPVESRGFQIIKDIIGSNFTYSEMSRNMLLSITNILSYLIGIPFPRNFSRRKALIIKWFDMYADQIDPLKGILTVDCKDDKTVKKELCSEDEN